MSKTISSFLLSVVMLTGCAHGKDIAVKTVQVSDVMADEIALGWGIYVDAMIVKCSRSPVELKTVAARRACMGKAGDGEKLEAAIAALVSAQLAVQAVIEGGPGDLNTLMARLTTAGEVVRPYFNAMKESK
jgi:hypothetical protein